MTKYLLEFIYCILFFFTHMESSGAIHFFSLAMLIDLSQFGNRYLENINNGFKHFSLFMYLIKNPYACRGP